MSAGQLSVRTMGQLLQLLRALPSGSIALVNFNVAFTQINLAFYVQRRACTIF